MFCGHALFHGRNYVFGRLDPTLIHTYNSMGILQREVQIISQGNALFQKNYFCCELFDIASHSGMKHVINPIIQQNKLLGTINYLI